MSCCVLCFTIDCGEENEILCATEKEVKGSKSFSSLFGGKFGGPDTVETISNKLNKIM